MAMRNPLSGSARRRWGVFVGMAMVAGGCGNEKTNVPAPYIPHTRLCDGSQERRLSIAVVSGSAVPGYDVLLEENGYPFLEVRGDCRYWVTSPQNYGHYRTGLLGSVEADLAADLFYGQWASRGLTKHWDPPAGVFDAASARFSDGKDRLAITEGPNSSDAPPESRS